MLLTLAVTIGLGAALMLPKGDAELPIGNRPVAQDIDVAAQTDNKLAEPDRPPPLPYIDIPKPDTPSPPIDRSTWHVEGDTPEFVDYGGDSDSLLIQLRDADTGEPISDFCKLWPMQDYGFFDWNYRIWLEPRTGWPSETGLIKVGSMIDEDGYHSAEIPVPVGYQLAEDPKVSLAKVRADNPTATLLFRRVPYLKIRVQSYDGQPVWDAQVYAVPVAPAAEVQDWGDLRSNVYSVPETRDDGSVYSESAAKLKEFNKDVENYFGQPFYADHIVGFKWNYFPSAGSEPYYPLLSAATTNHDGLCVLDELFAGEWEVGVFMTGKGDFQRRRVKLDSSTQELAFVVEMTPIARVNIDIDWQADDSDGRYYQSDLIELGADPRAIGHEGTWWPTTWRVNWTVDHLEYRFQKEGDWLLKIGACELKFQSKFGEVQNLSIKLETKPAATWTPEFMLNGEPSTETFYLYSQTGVGTEFKHHQTQTLVAGECFLFLPGGQKYQFRLKPGEQATHRIELKVATVEVEVDEFIYDLLKTDSFYIDDSRCWNIGDEAELIDGRWRKKFAVTPGEHSYQLDKFKGVFRIQTDESLLLQFTKEACTGLACLTITDECSGRGPRPWLQRLETKSVGYPQVDASATDAIYMDGTTFFLFAKAGFYFLNARRKDLPIELPGELLLTDELIENYDENTEVIFVTPEYARFTSRCFHESGAEFKFSSGANELPAGRYNLHIIEDYDEYADVPKVPRHTSIEFDASKGPVTLDWQHLDWQNLVRVEVQLHGLGDTLAGSASWWTGYNDFCVFTRPGWGVVATPVTIETISLNPAQQKALAWLLPGDYELHSHYGAEPTKFKVGKRAIQLTIKSKP
ncbi:hypothetical protein OAU50_04620 [Planctomycetota bacterium]|nr:hypothetical protein [Planctomycetota bacterium]